MKKPKYVVDGNQLRIPHDFDEKLDLGQPKFKTINELIFEEEPNKCKYSDFNHPIILTLIMRVLRFGHWFNQPIVLTKRIVHLAFGCYFTQPIVLSKHIVHLTFGFYFNQPIILTKHLTVLTFDYGFNQPIILPQYLLKLRLGYCFVQSIVLTQNITVLSLGNGSFCVSDNLPNNIKYLQIGQFFTPSLNNMPSNTIVKRIF